MKYSDKLTSGQSRKAFTMLLCCFAAAGVIAGSVYGASAAPDLPVWIHQFFLPETGGISAFGVMKRTMLSSFLFIAAAYFLGLSAFGQPLGIGMIVFRGFGVGAASAVLYAEAGSAAVPRVLLLLLPKAVAVIFVSVIAVRELMRASRCIMRMWLYGDAVDERIVDLKRYSLKYAVLLLLSLLITLADGAVNSIYGRIG